MPAADINLEGDNAWPDLRDRDGLIHLTDPWKIALFKGGMTSGKSSIALRLDLPDGRVVVTETSVEILRGIWRAVAARCEDEVF